MKSTPVGGGRALLDCARTISSAVLRPHAGEVDRENRFPNEAFTALRDAGLLRLFVPPEMGGPEFDIPTYCRIAGALGANCLATAINWVMHTHQIAILADHGRPALDEVLEEVNYDQFLIGSVTTEYAKNADLTRAHSFLKRVGDRYLVQRRAPISSFSKYAGGFLILMRISEDAPANDTRLVYLKASDAPLKFTGGWTPLGMRGTQSMALDFEAELDASRVLPVPFPIISQQTMIPLSVLGFAAAWSSAARAQFDAVTEMLRPSLDEPGSIERIGPVLARIRMSLDMLDCYILDLAKRVDRSRRTGVPLDLTLSAILFNSLKVSGSEVAHDVIHQLIQLVGMKFGYIENDKLPLPRVARDLRSASLMFNNTRLLESTAGAIFMERVMLGDTPSFSALVDPVAEAATT